MKNKLNREAKCSDLTKLLYLSNVRGELDVTHTCMWEEVSCILNHHRAITFRPTQWRFTLKEKQKLALKWIWASVRRKERCMKETEQVQPNPVWFGYNLCLFKIKPHFVPNFNYVLQMYNNDILEILKFHRLDSFKMRRKAWVKLASIFLE